MKIFTAEQTRTLDRLTIAREPIASVDLMERAARAFTGWFEEQFPHRPPVGVFCGPGNNGGDGLAIARMLRTDGYDARPYVIRLKATGSPDFEENLRRLRSEADVFEVARAEDLPGDLPDTMVLIDALFGAGLARPLEGLPAAVVAFLNGAGRTVVSVDIASGLFADQPTNAATAVVRPHLTYTFQFPKLAFMVPENEAFVGRWWAGDIGLDARATAEMSTPYAFTDAAAVRSLYRPRGRFAHKGTFGRAVVVGGSWG
ncbi:MAG: NAD(P)H-hydrate epimerase, partial [Catalinimonas sp.]